MTRADAALLNALNRRINALQPQLRSAWIEAVGNLRRSLNEKDIIELILSGRIDAIIPEDSLVEAWAPLRRGTTAVFRKGLAQTWAGELGISAGASPFTVVNPRVIEGIRTLEATLLKPLGATVRETVRAAVEAGLREAKHPRTIARGLRQVIGLAPNQELAVRNFRRALIDGNAGKAMSYALRDRRFDKTIAKGITDVTKIDAMVAAYRRKMEAFHAETIARTATLNAYREGRHEAFGSAIDRGIIPAESATKTWQNVGDDRVRDEHLDVGEGGVSGETVPFDMPFSNGLDYPMEYNCRCQVVYGESP